MDTSVRWLNDYLDPPATADEQAVLATRAGFPLEGREDVEVSDGTDVRQDFEMTSNRGDCVCHLGLAREIAAISGRSLRPPAGRAARGTTPASDLVTVTNRESAACPLYTARVIRGVRIGPSPAWLADRLVARGDLPRNNVVDATNFVLFELGQPTHVFDLARLRGSAIVVRLARPDEPFLPIGEAEAEIRLSAEDLVIADEQDAVALAGVKGGALTAVSETTTDLLLEAATFDPVAVRTTSRRHGIASDSSYRFERGVHPGQIDAAAERLAALILELAGGELCDGVVLDGAPIPASRVVSMRPARCRRLLGVPVSDEQMMIALGHLGFEPRTEGDRIACTVPIYRLDVEREIDLVEEVGRMHGHDNIPVRETIQVRITPPQPTEMARQAVANELVGMGFVETVTHSLVDDRSAAPFLGAGEQTLRVSDDRAKAEPVLQPSVLPSLLRVRRHNQDNGADRLRLFESAATFRATGDGHEETVRLGLLMDADDDTPSVRPLRGVIQRLAEVLMGHDVTVEVEADDSAPWIAAGAGGRASIDGRPIGRLGVVEVDVTAGFGLDAPVVAAELELADLYAQYPPVTEARALPAFPAIERDLSPVLDEAVSWQSVQDLVHELEPDFLDAVEFVTTFRGAGVGEGRKALTLRLRFRAPDRTLTHDEVDPQVGAVIGALESRLDATLRTRRAGAPADAQ